MLAQRGYIAVEVEGPGGTSLLPVGVLRHLVNCEVHVKICHTVQEEVLHMPHIQPTADVRDGV